jgi:hypothetical protein
VPNAFPILRDGNRQLAVNVGEGLNFSIPAADNEPERNTYRSFVFGLNPTGAVSDLVALGGSATKLIRLKGVIVSGTASAATNIGLYVFKRTAVYTGGTPTPITRVAADTTDPAATATLNHYATAAPTVGAGAMIDGCRLNLAPAANGSIDRFLFQYTWQNDKAPNLRGVAEFIGIGMNGVSMPAGGALDVALVWTEE